MVLIAALCLNGFAVRVFEAVATGSAPTSLLGISPFEIVAVAIAALVLLEAPQGPNVLGAPRIDAVDGLAGLCLLAPSSTVSWIALLGYAGWRARGAAGAERRAFALLMAVAASALWASHGAPLIGSWITPLEALAAGALLSLVEPQATVHGNVVGIPDRFLLVVMTACSVVDAGPRLMVATAAVLLFIGATGVRPVLQAGAVALAVFIAINITRLAVMAHSQEAYDLAHGPLGASLFDGIIVAAVFVAAAAAKRGRT